MMSGRSCDSTKEGYLVLVEIYYTNEKKVYYGIDEDYISALWF